MNIKTLGAAILVGAVVAGCDKGTDKAGEKKPAEKDSVAVTVNGKQLMKSQIDADVEAVLKAQGDNIPAAQREYARQSTENQLVRSFIVENVLVAKAKEEGYVITDADRKAREAEFLKNAAKLPDAPKSLDDFFKKFPLGEERGRQEFENGILIDKLIKAQQAKLPQKDYAAEAKKSIDDIVSKNAKVADSEKAALDKIKELKAALDKAEDVPAKFAELAKANSQCPSASSGGDLKEFTRGQMVPEFDKAAFTLPVGKVSEPIKTQFGYHLVLVTKKVPAVEAKGDSPAVPEKVRASHILIKADVAKPVPKAEDVIARLKERDEGRFVREFVMQLLGDAKIEASENFKRFLPPVAKKAEAKPAKLESKPVEAKPVAAPTSVEKPAAK